jgi:hypothetical protein
MRAAASRADQQLTCSTEALQSGDRQIACVLPTASGDPHAYHNRANDDQDAYELKARRVIGPSVGDGGDSERDGKDGNQVLHGVSLPRGRTPMLSGRGMDAGSGDYTKKNVSPSTA